MDSLLHVQEIGEGLPILIIHGWQMQGAAEQADFEPIFNHIPGIRRIYPDLPGMGKTPANGIQGLDDIYRSLIRFIDERLRDIRFLVVGSSCGGYLARAVAHKYSDQVDGLLLRVPLIETRDDKRDADAFTPLVKNEQLISSLSAIDKALLGDVLIQTPAYIDTVKAKSKQVYVPAKEASDEKALDPIRAEPEKYRLSFASEFENAKFLAPTLIICGRQDESVGYRDSLRLLELYPRSTCAVLDRGTHGLPVDDSEVSVFAALLRDWIYRVHEWRDRTQL